jgi:hypothetical protein
MIRHTLPKEREHAPAGGHPTSPAAETSCVTTHHDFIRRWVEERGGRPAKVKGTERGAADVGMLRIDFPGYSGEGKLESISWDEFFEKFEQSKLAFVYEEHTTGGQKSNFNKLVSRGTPNVNE